MRPEDVLRCAMGQGSKPHKSTYRLFWTNGAGRIDSVADTVQAEDDDDALRQAQALSKGRTVEVWLGARKVAMLNGASRTEQ